MLQTLVSCSGLVSQGYQISKLFKMCTKEKIEKELLKAMNAFDEMQRLVHEIPEEEGYQDCFMSNLVDMKSRCKQFLNKDFDYLARQRKKTCAERAEELPY